MLYIVLMKKPNHRIATSISKSNWYAIKNYLIRNGWKLVDEYNEYDKEVYYDSFTLKKSERIFYMAWASIELGEVCSTPKHLEIISKNTKIKFKYGTARLIRLGIVKSIKVEYRK